MTGDASWRLRLRRAEEDGSPGEVIGAAFAVTDDLALSTAHHIEPTCGHREGDPGAVGCMAAKRPTTKLWVEQPRSGRPAQLCAVESIQPDHHRWDASLDVAVIRVPAAFEVAPLGSPTLRDPRIQLEVFGFPKTYRDRGQAAWVTGANYDETGHLLQVNGAADQPSIVEGYSGSAAVDTHSSRVVGMMIERDRDIGKNIAWILPLATIARAWPQLSTLLPDALSVDPEFVRAVHELRAAAYGEALTRLNGIYRLYPAEADVYYYRALAGLSGKRPGTYTSQHITNIEMLLRKAMELNSSAWHVWALYSLVVEDYYFLRGLKPRPYTDEQLHQLAASMRPEHIDELIHHAPARECPMWKILYNRRLA